MSGYDFSQLFHGSLLSYSPGTTFLATAYQNRIIVRSTSNLQIVRTWTCSVPPPAQSTSRDKQEPVSIDTLEWSGDSMYLVAFSAQSKTTWIYGLAEDGEGESGELARIGGEGVEGVVSVQWAKGGRDVLSWSDYGLKLSIHNLTSGMTRVIQSPKSPQCLTYSPDTRYMAVTEKHLGKEYVGVYDVLDGYTLFRHFPLLTNDVQGISWSPCGRYIAAWDSPLSYSIHVHSPIGPHLTHFSSASPTFSPIPNSDPGLGIRTIAWAPGGRFLLLGGWDGRVRVVECEGWRCVGLLQWGGRTAEREVAVWREPSAWLKDTRGRGIVQFDRVPTPAAIPSIRPDMSRPNPRTGVNQLSFDRDGTLLLVRLDSSPNVVHIHTFLPEPTEESPHITHLATLIFSNPVRRAEWCPSAHAQGTSKKLALATRGGAVYFWDGESGWVDDSAEVDFAGAGQGGEGDSERGGMIEGVGVPANPEFAAHSIQWAPDGTSLAIQDKDTFVVLYNDEGEDENSGAGASTSLLRGEQSDWSTEGLTHIEEEEYEEGWSGYGLQIRDGLRAGLAGA